MMSDTLYGILSHCSNGALKLKQASWTDIADIMNENYGPKSQQCIYQADCRLSCLVSSNRLHLMPPPPIVPSSGETPAPPDMHRPREMPCRNQSTCSRFRSCQGQMTHFSVVEREGRDVRKQGRRQVTGSVEKERGR